MPKLLQIEKEIVRDVARGDEHYLKESADHKAQIRKAFGPHQAAMNYGHIIYGHVCSGTWVYFADSTINYVWSRFIFILLRSRFPYFSCSSLRNFVLSQTVDV